MMQFKFITGDADGRKTMRVIDIQPGDLLAVRFTRGGAPYLTVAGSCPSERVMSVETSVGSLIGPVVPDPPAEQEPETETETETETEPERKPTLIASGTKTKTCGEASPDLGRLEEVLGEAAADHIKAIDDFWANVFSVRSTQGGVPTVGYTAESVARAREAWSRLRPALTPAVYASDRAMADLGGSQTPCPDCAHTDHPGEYVGLFSRGACPTCAGGGML